MLNPRENMVLIDGIIKTVEIDSIQINELSYKYDICFRNSEHKCYSYSRNKVVWLTNPIVFNPKNCQVYYKGKKLFDVIYIAAFKYHFFTYWVLDFANGSICSFYGNDITIKKSCLEDNQSQSVFEYLRSVAAVNPLKSEDDGTPLLLRQYQGVDFIGDDRAAAPYLNPREFQTQKFVARPLIFPFGCNASQQKAVQSAFENQISIIQGPPGTGKTQTILNIVANIILQGKTVMVVSNNNSAIENVVEKIEHYNMGFITAMLGSRANKDAFIAAQETEKLIPDDIEQWHSIEADNAEYLHNIDNQTKALADVFTKQERLALARQELDALKIEQVNFEQETELNSSISIRKQLSLVQLMMLWNELQDNFESERRSGIFAKITNTIRDIILEKPCARDPRSPSAVDPRKQV